jgi:DNA helicase-2/ATP-dependent DNA helicase PcrA
MEPTAEQAAIIDAAKTTKDSLLISALAGAAKTTTLAMICQRLPLPILSLAFNKRIADEMKTKLPGNVTPMTLNAIGHRTWAAAIGKRLNLDADKSHKLLKAKIDTFCGAEKNRLYEDFADLRKIIAKAKLSGYIPEAVGRGTPLLGADEFFGGLDEELPPLQERIVNAVLGDSIQLALGGEIDFDDQIYMPTLFGGSFPTYPLVMVDEAQDLSSINHQMLAKIARQRLIAVGDPYQSIYGFRGAVSNGMDSLRERFSLRELGLSTSFRCPISVVELARSRAPHMQYPTWAKPGQVTFQGEWNSSFIPEGAAIICRNNAPILRLGFRLIKEGLGVKILGADIGPQLIKVLEKLGDSDLKKGAVLLAIDKWEAEKLAKSRVPASLSDRAECLRIFAEQADTLSGAIAYAKYIFAAQGTITMMTGHKSKGGEWDNVYFLDEDLLGDNGRQFGKPLDDEAVVQEKNLRYVMQTRAKDSLHHIYTSEMK